MLFRTGITSSVDKDRLLTSVGSALNSWVTYTPNLESFRSSLRLSDALAPQDVPADMITMNSRFVVGDPDGEATTSYTLVFPEDADEDPSKLTVLSPMGMALLGARPGDTVNWISAAGPGSTTVIAILYQPESAGDPL
jgi:regulator of nucleoside diphosphate kinase